MPRGRLLHSLAVLGTFTSGCAGALPIGATSVSLDAPAAPAVRADRTPPPLVDAMPLRNAADAPGAVAFVETVGDRAWLVVGEAAGGEVATRAALLSTSERSITVMEAKARLSAVDPEARLGGRSFDLYREDTKVCTVEGGQLRVLGLMFTPDDAYGDADGDGVTSPEELWSLTGRYLALPVALPDACRKATWARLTELPEPRFAEVLKTVPAPLGARTEVDFRASVAWAGAQESYVESQTRMGGAASGGTWEDVASVTEITWSAPFLGASWTVRQAVWDEGCGASAALTMAWRSAGPESALVHTGTDRFTAEVVLDLDGDGTMEMIGSSLSGRELRRFFGQEDVTVRSFAVQDHGCSC